MSGPRQQLRILISFVKTETKICMANGDTTLPLSVKRLCFIYSCVH